jgi:hypothetical protein
MCAAIPQCLVSDDAELVSSLELPDPEDRHVLAAAIQCQAQAIVTNNLKDFPAAALEPHGVKALSADEFLLELVELVPDRVFEVLRRQAAALRRPPGSVETLLSTLAQQGLRRAVAALQAL